MKLTESNNIIKCEMPDDWVFNIHDRNGATHPSDSLTIVCSNTGMPASGSDPDVLECKYVLWYDSYDMTPEMRDIVDLISVLYTNYIENRDAFFENIETYMHLHGHLEFDKGKIVSIKI